MYIHIKSRRYCREGVEGPAMKYIWFLRRNGRYSLGEEWSWKAVRKKRGSYI